MTLSVGCPNESYVHLSTALLFISLYPAVMFWAWLCHVASRSSCR